MSVTVSQENGVGQSSFTRYIGLQPGFCSANKLAYATYGVPSPSIDKEVSICCGEILNSVVQRVSHELVPLSYFIAVALYIIYGISLYMVSEMFLASPLENPVFPTDTRSESSYFMITAS